MQKLFPVASSAVLSPHSSDSRDSSYNDMSFPNFHESFSTLFFGQFTIAYTSVSAFATKF
jgi:hypothetical protein